MALAIPEKGARFYFIKDDLCRKEFFDSLSSDHQDIQAVIPSGCPRWSSAGDGDA
jgi:hypothetical protein